MRQIEYDMQPFLEQRVESYLSASKRDRKSLKKAAAPFLDDNVLEKKNRDEGQKGMGEGGLFSTWIFALCSKSVQTTCQVQQNNLKITGHFTGGKFFYYEIIRSQDSLKVKVIERGGKIQGMNLREL